MSLEGMMASTSGPAIRIKDLSRTEIDNAKLVRPLVMQLQTLNTSSWRDAAYIIACGGKAYLKLTNGCESVFELDLSAQKATIMEHIVVNPSPISNSLISEGLIIGEITPRHGLRILNLEIDHLISIAKVADKLGNSLATLYGLQSLNREGERNGRYTAYAATLRGENTKALAIIDGSIVEGRLCPDCNTFSIYQAYLAHHTRCPENSRQEGFVEWPAHT